MWGITVPIIGAVASIYPAGAIVVTPPGGEPPNRVEVEKHISYALTASSVAPVQDQACALELSFFSFNGFAVVLREKSDSKHTQHRKQTPEHDSAAPHDSTAAQDSTQGSRAPQQADQPQGSTPGHTQQKAQRQETNNRHRQRRKQTAGHDSTPPRDSTAPRNTTQRSQKAKEKEKKIFYKIVQRFFK